VVTAPRECEVDGRGVPPGASREGGADRSTRISPWYSRDVNLEARERLERDVRALCQRADYPSAVTMALRGYGPELLTFLHAVHPCETDATDAFADLSEILWRKLPGFAWESSLRTWCYGIARNISRVLRRNAGRRRRREAPVGDSALENVAERVRTETLAHLRTQTKTRLQSLRDALPEEDRTLLILRVDRALEWNDLARVLSGRGNGVAPLGDADVKREAARLRKRFQLVKEKLRDMAKREGLAG
jgi:RNA polymerase sigma-70 factor (ECF subfamily)